MTESDHSVNKKAFKSNANGPLADSPCFLVNKFECVSNERGRGGPCTARSKFNVFE